jgi:hypothetical protein
MIVYNAQAAASVISRLDYFGDDYGNSENAINVGD